MSQEDLPIKVERNQLAVNKRNNKRIIEVLKRTGKIALSVGIGLTGIVVSAAAGPVVATSGMGVALSAVVGNAIAATGMGVGVAGLANAAIDTIYKKTSKNSMFVQSKSANGEIKISQSAKDFKSFQKMKGFKPFEKLAMMGLELLVEMQSIKQQFEDKGIATEEAKDGENNVYPQIYTTKTHSGNIDTIEALEQLGYLEIQRKEPKGKSSLFFERLGFGQYKEAKEALLEKDENKKTQMYDLAFKVTDKPIDLEEIYKSYIQARATKEKNENTPSIRRIGVILEALRNQNIDIVKNDIGETIIDYKAQEPFARRIKRENTNSCKEYRKASYIGASIEQGPVEMETKETTQVKENIQQEEEHEL